MKTGSKVAIAGAGALALFGLYAYNKKRDFEKVITEMTLDISNVRKLSFGTALKLLLYCDVTFKNNTNTAFDINTAGLIVIKTITLYYKDKKLGVAKSNTSKFILPANGEQKITNVQVELISLNIFNQLFSASFDADPENYKIEVEIFALGKTYLIEQ